MMVQHVDCVHLFIFSSQFKVTEVILVRDHAEYRS